MINMANQLAMYLQREGEGMPGYDLFVDSDSPAPDEAVFISHAGGSSAWRLDAPGSWRKLSLLVRSATPGEAEARMWRIIGKLQEPATGLIEGEGGPYTSQITALPAVQALDSAGRYAMRAVLTLSQVKPVAESWLEALSQFTEGALGGQWRVYRGFNGTCRPSVSWQCTGWHSAAASRGAYQLSKQFAGQLAARSANEVQLAAQLLMLGLSEQVKLPLGGPGSGGRWLTVLSAEASMRSGDLSTASLTVTLTGAAQGAGPLIDRAAGNHHMHRKETFIWQHHPSNHQ
ncbi:minor capsid protein [Paenibacillus sp. GCM10023248]|uniref:minor capsid protein n=1 Tax=Bacillales TaxID=1385 RepID=UPI002378A409|nr:MULTISPECIES: minor capsid protein [Bacillales]MDD9266490.1 minor capsid protein [Paenibacillus sp. MAHUQ-63]MDR6878616.1 hypothetical protein [Bacillus sp. 3255]